MGFNIKNLGRSALSVATGGRLDALRGLAGNQGGQQSGPALPEIPKFDMKKTSDFITQDPQIKVGNPDAMVRRFQGMKERVGNQSNAQLQSNSDALKRKFASQGAVGSGAEIKAQMMLQDQAQRAKDDALTQLDAMEQEAWTNQSNMQAEMDFRQRVFSFERGSKMHELDLAERQQQQDAVATEINARVAKEQMKPPKQGLLSNLLGDLL